MSLDVREEIISVKILVIGNSGVGKTSLCHRYINEIFVKAYKPTVGGCYFSLTKLTVSLNFSFSKLSRVLFQRDDRWRRSGAKI